MYKQPQIWDKYQQGSKQLMQSLGVKIPDKSEFSLQNQVSIKLNLVFRQLNITDTENQLYWQKKATQVETGMAVGEENEFYLHLNVLVPKNGLKQNIGETKLPRQSSLKKKKKN